MNAQEIKSNFARDIVVLKRYFKRKTMKSTPMIIASIKPAMPVCDVHIKDTINSPISLKRDNRVLIEFNIIRRIISIIISNGVLTIFTHWVFVNKNPINRG
jgi:hypothetical protein